MSGQLKEVRERIISVNSTQQITKAMKMVSAAKLRKAQQAITEMRPYANRLNHILRNILSNLDGDTVSSFGIERDVQNVAVVIITSSKGLCGAFNSNIVKAAINEIEVTHEAQWKKGNVKVFPVGKKAFEYLKKRYEPSMFVKDYTNIFADLTVENIQDVSQRLMDAFEASEFDKVIVCYSQFKNAGVQYPMAVQYLPVEKVEVEPGAHTKRRADYIFEPGKEALLKELIPSILHTTFQKYLFDTHASEHGARMTAMDKATENAEELKKELKINYNKARQEAITKELSEIVGGAAALGG